MTPQELQNYVDKKDWVNLSKKEMPDVWRVNIDLNKEFFEEFVVSDIFIVFIKNQTYNSRVYNLVRENIYDFDLSVDFWYKYVNNWKKIIETLKERKDDSFKRDILYYRKPVNYFKAILKYDDMFKSAFSFFGSTDSYDCKIPYNVLKAFSAEDIVKFQDKLVYRDVQASFEDPKDLFNIMGKDLDKFWNFLKNYRFNLDSGAALKNVDYNDFTNSLAKHIDELSLNHLEGAARWFMYNPGSNVPDAFIQKVLNSAKSYDDKRNEIIRDISNNLTEDQIQEIIPSLSILEVASIKAVDLATVSKMVKDQNYSILGSRYFTDEEIAAYPNLFDPNDIKQKKIYVYISKPTWKQINAQWGRRLQYERYYEQFWSIYRSCINANIKLTSNDIKYIIEKTNADFKTIVDTMNCGVGKPPKINILSKFYEKYK